MPQSNRCVKELKIEVASISFFDSRAWLVPLAISLLFLVVPWSSAFGQESIISGRVVDDAGKPVSGAAITLYIPPAPGAFEIIMPGVKSLPDGVFFLHSGSITSSRGLKLFIEEPVPHGFWSPFNGPPFGKLSRLPPFRGIPIRLRYHRARIDLGDVPAGIRYAKVVLDLTRVWPGKPNPSLEELAAAKLRVRDGVGNIIYDGRMPESALNPESLLLNLALTKGRWMVEISLGESFRSPRRYINVTTLSCLKVALAGTPVQKDCR